MRCKGTTLLRAFTLEAHIFDTKRLLVRKLKLSDLEPFHLMQGNPNVMRFVRPKPNTYKESIADLDFCIANYKPKSEFLIYAVLRKHDSRFIGSVALVKTKDGKDEIGYRLLESEWGKGYGKEMALGLITYCKSIGMKELVAFAAYENEGSIKILEGLGFTYKKDFFAEDLQIQERKYTLTL